MKLVLLTIFLVAAVLAEPNAESRRGFYLPGPYRQGRDGLVKRSADAEPDSNPEAITNADADAKAYYLLHGYWPVGYAGYYTRYPYYSHYGYYGRKKRSAEPESAPEPAAISKADSDAYLYYTTYGYWPAGYTGFYYTHPWVWGRKKRSPESEPEAGPDGKADPHLYSYYYYPYYTHSYYPYYWYGK